MTIPPPALRFLLDQRIPGVLATIGVSGGPVTSSVWYTVEDDAILISTPQGRTKARNASANPRVSFLVDRREQPYCGVAIEGTASLLADPAGEGWRRIATRYLGPELPATLIDRFKATPRVLLRIEPRRVRSWNIGD